MIPAEFLQATPTAGSVRFAGVYLNLREIARYLNHNPSHSHLSRIFSSDRTPSVRMMRRLAVTLNMTSDEFLIALEDRKNRTKIA